MHHAITGVLLAGGNSTRMGTNKALLPLGEGCVIEHIARMLCSRFAKVILVSDDAESYRFLGLPTYPDIYAGRGPLAGIHAALVHAQSENIFVVSCDMPLVTAAMVDHIVAGAGKQAICVPFADGFVQYLCGLYHQSVLPLSERILLEDNVEVRAVHQQERRCPLGRLMQEAGGHVLDVQPLLGGDDALMFANMNRREEYQLILQHCQG